MVAFKNIGIRPYVEVLELQRSLQSSRRLGQIGDTVIFCEHSPVFTIGKRDSSDDWVSDLSTIAGVGIDVVKTDRGGRITYHGPGQLIAYFIFDLNRLELGIKDFVRQIEECCIEALATFGIDAVRNKEHPGLWVGDKKIMALGFHVSGGITMHGIAINISPELSHYKHIVPCGIKDKGITSMQELLGARTPTTDAVINSLKLFLQRFDR